MNRDSSFDDRFAAWLADEAPTQVPDRVVHATLERTRATRQAWTLPGGRKGIMSYRMVGLGAAALVVVVAVMIGTGLRQPVDGPGTGTSSPTTTATTPTTTATTPTPGTSAASAGPSALLPSAAAIPTSSIPAVSGLPGRIAFARPNGTFADVSGSSDIWVMNPDRSGLQQLTTASGSNRQPAWSPDGTRIAFSSERDGERAIWVMDADGSNQARVTPAGANDSWEPAWSPDGTTIAFYSGSPQPGGEAEGVYLIDVDGSDLRPLILVGEHEMTFASQPLWSPDGSTILIRGESDLFLIGVDGTEFRNLTNTPDFEDSAGSWSKDGNWIAFQADQGGGCLFKIKPDGSGFQRLTFGCEQGISMSWAPDGSHLAWAGGSHGVADLFVVTSDGTNELQLTDTRDISEISWGP